MKEIQRNKQKHIDGVEGYVPEDFLGTVDAALADIEGGSLPAPAAVADAAMVARFDKEVAAVMAATTKRSAPPVPKAPPTPPHDAPPPPP